MPGDTQRAAATARAGSIRPLGLHPLALVFAIAVHLAAGVGLLGRFSPRKPDETPATLDLVLAAPTPAENTPTEAPTEPTPPAPPAPADEKSDNTVPVTEQAPPPAPPPPEPAPPEPAPPPPPALPKDVAQAIPPALPPPKPSITPFRRPPRTVESPHPHAAPPAHDDASALPAAAPLQQPVSPPPAPAPSSDPAWSSALSGWLQGHRSYPEAARRRGEQGQVGVRFTVSRDGLVQNVTLTRPSGYEALDAAAQTMLQNAHVPAFPASMTQPSITVTVTIRFTLEK